MIITTESFYFYYVLQFIDDEMKICQSMNETFCSESIQGANTDIFHQKYDKSFQFMFTENHCIVKELNNNTLNSNRELYWMQKFIEYHLKIYHLHHYFNQKNILFNAKEGEQERSNVFFVRKLDLKMKIKLFEKLTNNSNYYKKDYSVEEIFFICYSHAFSIFDNRIIILKNILYLLLQGLFNFNDIYHEFLKNSTENYKQSINLKKINEQINASNEIELSYFIDQFLTENLDYKSNDTFMHELFHWHNNCLNMVFLIQQTFSFQVKNNNAILFQINHSSNCESKYDFTIQDSINFIPLLSDKSIFSCNDFQIEMNEFFNHLLQMRKNMKLKIEITEFWRNFKKIENVKIIEKCINFENFLGFLLDKTNSSITLIIESIEFSILQKNNQYQQSSTFSESTNFCDGESLLISSFILIQKNLKIGHFLKDIAKSILSNFKKYKFTDNLRIISLYANHFIHQFSHSLDTFTNENIFLNQYLQCGGMEKLSDDQNELFFIDGTHYSGFDLISIERCDQKFQNLDFFSGIVNDTFSLYVVDPQSNMTSSSFNLITELNKNSKNKFPANDVKLYNDHDLFLIESYSDNIEYFIFHYFLQYEEQILTNLNCSFVDSFKKMDNCIHCDQKLIFDLNIKKNEPEKQILKLYYNKVNEVKNFIYMQTNYKETQNTSFRKLSDIYFDFEIMNSNFHLILQNIFECVSINRDLASIHKHDIAISHQIDINHSIVKFLSPNFHIFDFITLNNCIIESNFELFSEKFYNTYMNIKFLNFRLSSRLTICNFAVIEPLGDFNKFHSEQDENYHTIQIENCKITIFKYIPQYISHIKLTNCTILFLDSIDISNTESSVDQCISNLKSSELIEKQHKLVGQNDNLDFCLNNCILHGNLLISGIFHSIKITNCSSNFTLEANYKEIDIQNHQGQFSIYPIVEMAISKGENDLLKIHNKTLDLRNLKIKNISNTKFNEIEINNCEINKIDNVQSSVFDILNSKCSFQICLSNIVQKYSGEMVNFHISENFYTTLLYYDISEEIEMN